MDGFAAFDAVRPAEEEDVVVFVDRELHIEDRNIDDDFRRAAGSAVAGRSVDTPEGCADDEGCVDASALAGRAVAYPLDGGVRVPLEDRRSAAAACETETFECLDAEGAFTVSRLSRAASVCAASRAARAASSRATAADRPAAAASASALAIAGIDDRRVSLSAPPAPEPDPDRADEAADVAGCEPGIPGPSE